VSNHLLRSHAPISDAAWSEIDEEARERLVAALAARKLVDFSGPHGWEHSATGLGRIAAIDAPVTSARPSVVAAQRSVLPLAELRAPFTLSRSELADLDRGAVDPDLAALDAAAHQLAIAENVAILHGWPAAGITGITAASPHAPLALGEVADDFRRPVATAVERLMSSGIDGPYALALGPEQYRRVAETAEHGGYPLLDHLKKIVDGPLVWAPGIDGAVVLSTRGGDFLFESGEDLSVGYASHDGETVQLYLEESFSFRVATPEAAVALTA
jgi:uncharacterized linocin/CFP29 family protein